METALIVIECGELELEATPIEIVKSSSLYPHKVLSTYFLVLIPMGGGSVHVIEQRS